MDAVFIFTCLNPFLLWFLAVNCFSYYKKALLSTFIKLLTPAVASRMASGGEGHRHARSQTMPIIRGKNALTNPKLLQMMETGITRTRTLIEVAVGTSSVVSEFFIAGSASRCKHSGWGLAQSYGHRGKLVHRGGAHCVGCTRALCSPSQGL